MAVPGFAVVINTSILAHGRRQGIYTSAMVRRRGKTGCCVPGICTAVQLARIFASAAATVEVSSESENGFVIHPAGTA